MSRYNKAYWDEYYQTHKKTILARRRVRYRKDPQYQGAIRERSAITQKLRNLGKPGSYPVVDFDGGKELTFSLLKIANASKGRKHWYLRRLVGEGIIPKPIYKNNRTGIYTESQKRLILRLIEAGIPESIMQIIFEALWKTKYKEETVNEYIKIYSGCIR